MTRSMLRPALVPTLLLLAALGCQSCASMQSMRAMVHDYFHPPGDALSAQEHLDLGLAYEHKGEPERAEAQYVQAAETLPEAWLLLGNLRYSQGRADQAAQAYEQAVAAMPDNAEAHNNLAWVWYEQGAHLEQAQALAERAVGLAPAGQEAPYLDTLLKIMARRAEGS